MTVTVSKKISEISSLSNSTTITKEVCKDENEVLAPEGYTCFLGTFQTPLLWFNITAMLILHILAVWMLFSYQHANYPLKLALWTYVTSYALIFGVTGGAHRLWTHRCYKAKTPLKVILITLFSGAMQNSMYDWVRNHRMHHRFADTDADPHNSKRGFFFCHVGWLLMKKHPEIRRKGKNLDMSDIKSDPIVQFHQKHYVPMALIAGFVLPTIVPPLLWGESWFWSAGTFFVRYTVMLNFTWFVNSIAHMWGSKPYDKSICPVEATSLIIFGNGEYWHNYHHTFPWDYKAAELGDYFGNSTAFWIQQFAKIGWAYDLKVASKELISKTVKKLGDGSHTYLEAVDAPLTTPRLEKCG